MVVAGAVLLDVWLHASGSGLKVRAVGFDERSAKRSGIRTNWVRVRALVLCSVLLAAAASFLVMARSPIGNAQIGSTFALSSITAAVLGGASLAGGRATFLGGLVAAILLALILTVLPYLGLSNSDGLMIIGILVLVGMHPVPVRRPQGAGEAELQAGAAPDGREQAGAGRRAARLLPGRHRVRRAADREEAGAAAGPCSASTTRWVTSPSATS